MVRLVLGLLSESVEINENILSVFSEIFDTRELELQVLLVVDLFSFSVDQKSDLQGSVVHLGLDPHEFL